MKVVFTTPHTGPLTFALGTSVVWIPPLTSEALVDFRSRVPRSPIESFHTFVVLEAKEDSTANHPLLGFLIFQTYYDFIRFTPIFFVEKPSYVSQLEIVSLLKLSFESVVIQVRVHSCNHCLIYYGLRFRQGGCDSIA